jgi:hypothetical protein
MNAARGTSDGRNGCGAQLVQDFREAFSMGELVESLVFDVNQPDPQAQRMIDRDSLAKWAAEQGE